MVKATATCLVGVMVVGVDSIHGINLLGHADCVRHAAEAQVPFVVGGEGVS